MKSLLACTIFGLTACVAGGGDDGASGGAGGKADESTTDGGTGDAGPALVDLAGHCTVSTTPFHNGYGYTDTSTEPIELRMSIDSENADGTLVGTVHVASPWGQIPDGMWRAWCHIAHQDFQPLGSACAIGPYTIGTGALGFGQGFVSFRHDADAGSTSLYISAHLELGRDSYYDTDWTKVSYSCSLP